MDNRLPLSDFTFCAIDLETTGVNPLFHRIVEVGIVRFRMSGPIDEYSTLVNPGMAIPEEAYSIHGISDSDVSDAPQFADVAQQVIDFCADSVLIAHNPSFDISFLARSYADAGVNPGLIRALDTVRLARIAFPMMENHRLPTLCRELGIRGTHHRALADALACMEVFIRAIRERDPDRTWKMSDLLRLHGEMVRPSSAKAKGSGFSMPGNLRPGVRARIRYEDGDGEVTEREIIPRSVVRMGKRTYLHAFCILRGSDRYFLTSRILEILR